MLTAIIFLLLCIVGMYRAYKQIHQAICDRKYWLIAVDVAALVATLVLGIFLLQYILTWIF